MCGIGHVFENGLICRVFTWMIIQHLINFVPKRTGNISTMSAILYAYKLDSKITINKKDDSEEVEPPEALIK